MSATDLSSIAPLRMHAVTLAADTAQVDADTLRANPSVKAVEADKVREAGAAPSDPAYADQWALPKIGWDKSSARVPRAARRNSPSSTPASPPPVAT